MKKLLKWGAIVLLAIIVLGAFVGGSGDAKDAADDSDNTSLDSGNDSTGDNGADEPAAPKPKPKLTSGQENALRAAENYIDFMPMSKAGLIRQLSSPAGDKYPKKDAVWAANHVDADWNAEAVEAAKNYLDMMPMSKDALIRQLSSSAGDRYTLAQAQFAANKVL